MTRAQPFRAFLSQRLPTEGLAVDLQRCLNPDRRRGRNVEGFAPNAPRHAVSAQPSTV
jgi:hypothetical protein